MGLGVYGPLLGEVQAGMGVREKLRRLTVVPGTDDKRCYITVGTMSSKVCTVVRNIIIIIIFDLVKLVRIIQI